MQRSSHSEVDLLTAVKRAAREVQQAATVSSRLKYSASRSGRSRGSRSSCGSRSDIDQRSDISGAYSTRSSQYSSASLEGLTLAEQQKAVQEQAFERYVANLEKDVQATFKGNSDWKQFLQDNIKQERDERRMRREQCLQVQDLLGKQIQDNKARRAETRRDFIEAASLHAFPLFTETFINEAEVEEYRQNVKLNWRKELEQQIICNETLRNMEERKAQGIADKRFSDAMTKMVKERGLERDRLANQGRELVNSWDRDCRLKSIKKACETGQEVIKEY